MGTIDVPLHDAGSPLAAISRGHPDLGVAVIRMAPAPAFKQAVRGGDRGQCRAPRQIATLIDHSAAKLTHIQRLPARVQAEN